MYNAYILQKDVNKINIQQFKNKEVIAYLFFGVCTTLINWVSYYICFNMCSVSNVLSTIIAWVLSVVFAFFTNKMWVFGSKSFRAKTMIPESVSFLASRAFTGVLDVIIMWITVDICQFNASLWKLLSNIIVVILNYVLSKLFVFKKK